MSGMQNVGEIAYDARIVTTDFDKDADHVEKRADDVATNVAKSGDKGFGTFAREASSGFETVASGLGRVLTASVLIGTTGAFGIGAAVKASWDQVSAVQQSTIALSAYEKNADKVSKTLSELVAYARSDLGVLFNRKDLFESAQNLKLYGDNTDDLVNHVKILSRSVGLGLATWEGLNNVIGRVGSTGKLYADDLQFLQNAGFKLDKSLSGTTQTFDSLFKLLDKGIPADAMAGQANTIVGLNVRLQTAFRGLGDAILGVNADTGKFVEDGLGFRLTMVLKQVTDLLKDPALKTAMRTFGQTLADIASAVIPALVKGFLWIVNNIDIVTSGIVALTSAFVFAKLAAIGLNLVVSVSPVMLLAEAVTVLVGVLTYLQLRFGYVTKAIEILQPSLDLISQNLSFITNGFKDVAKTAGGVNWGEKAVVGIRNGLIFLNAAIIQTGVFFKQTAVDVQALYNRFMNLTPVIIIGQYITQVFIPAIMAIGAALYQNLLPALGQLWTAFTRLWEALNPALIDALKIVAVILGGALLAALYITTTALNIGIQAFSMYVSVISNVIGWIANLIAWFGNLIGALYNFAKIWVTVLWNLPQAIMDVYGTLQSIVGGFQGMILGALGDMGKLLFNAGKSLIEGFINGIKDKFGDVKSTLGDLTKKLTSWKGPESLDRVLLKGSGQLVIGGFISGLESMYGNVHRSLGGLTNSIGVSPVTSPTSGMGSLSALDTAPRASSGGSSVTMKVDMSGIMTRSKADEREVARSLVSTLNDELRAKGRPELGGGEL